MHPIAAPRRLSPLRTAATCLTAVLSIAGCSAGDTSPPASVVVSPGNGTTPVTPEPGDSTPGNPENPASGGEAPGNPPGSGADTSDDGVLIEGPTIVVDEAKPGSSEPVPAGCGDGTLTEDEACDDGNLVSGDGCASNCLTLEPGFSCAQPGFPCQPIARCGDGVVAPSEQCDDGNLEAGDGCSERCRIERGMKCEGSPSACTITVCGDGVREGAEACDDGNTLPFDGCSADCATEPDCGGTSCASECGDGIVIDEECDDGNRIDGDGCSAACTIEAGFSCEQTSTCERIGDVCVLRVPVIYRDFSQEHPDFGGHNCNELALGAVANELSAAGKPTLGDSEGIALACLSNEANLAEWYVATEHSQTLVSELLLFDNEAGGYVNRFGANGERFEAVDPASERPGGADAQACEASCVTHARNGEAPLFDAPLRCEDECRPIEQERSALVSGELSALQGDLNRASDAVPRDEALIADIETAIAGVEAELALLEQAIVACEADCAVRLEERVSQCAATCAPCSTQPDRWCSGGTATSFDGDPLFFPVDGLTGETVNSAPALVPAQYGYSNWPWERDIFPDAPDHNFFFTSEVKYWFRYDADTTATLDFLGDDDVWVFINRRLALDLGGIHAPASGSVTIDAAAGTVNSVFTDGINNGLSGTREASAEQFELEEGGVYEISVFHAERQLDGSSFKLTLAGFEATPSECSAICGDGVLSFGEECDDGVNDGGYGECAPGCVLGPFCGDGVVQAEGGETCDEGPLGSDECRGCRTLQPPRVR